MRYFRQLDSLRLIAVMIVIFHHLPVIPPGGVTSALFEGITGVDIFFVLSGFLITNILIHSKTTNSSVGDKLKTFYIRRFFRIFPIYYLSIFALILINPSDYRHYCQYDLLYISNIKMGLDGHFSSVTPHFWSLAVEEQFYLFWPVVIFFTTRKNLVYVISAFFLVGLISKLGSMGTSYDFFVSRTVGNLSYLASGGILAYLFDQNKALFQRLSYATIYIFLLYISAQLMQYYGLVSLPAPISVLINYTLCIFLVISFSAGIRGVTGKIADHPFPSYFGKISYGLYIYHMLMIIPLVALSKGFEKLFHVGLLTNLYTDNAIKIILTFITAAVSWKLIEKPVNKLKDKFTYR